MNDFVLITFGPAEDVRNGWYNCKERFSHKRAAIRKGMDSLCIAGCFGYVVIEEGKDYWKVIDECGAPAHAVSIGCRNNSYFVEPAPFLTLV